ERSVHLTDWPDAAELPADPTLVDSMDRAREICSTTSALRKAAKLRARLPLASLTVVSANPSGLEAFVAVVQDEVNVKDVRVVDLARASEADFGVTQRLTVNARAAGPRLGRDVQVAIRGSKSGDWSLAQDGTVTAGGLALEDGEFSVDTVVDQASGTASRAVAMLPGGGFIVLDTDVTPELAREGLANDLVRAVQQGRRETGLHVSDRISLTITGDDEVYDATMAHRDHIVSETLATQFGSSPRLDDLALGDGVSVATVGDGSVARIMVVKR
ncbi:MAG: DUF5915 domain-containing protein, partial [Actinomycetota bacterium]|nr:DUF5915 domain-containing protein [Actinomycetota bacterium]